MKESVYEKIRNMLTPIQMVLDVQEKSKKGSLIQRARNSMEDIKEILNKIERNG